MSQENNALSNRLVSINESLEEKNTELEKTVADQDKKIADLSAQLEEFSKLGTPASISESLTELAQMNMDKEAAEEKVAKIEESLKAKGILVASTGDVLQDINESFDNVTKIKDELDSLREEFGGVEEINEAFMKSEAVVTQVGQVLKELGTDLPGLAKFAKSHGTITEISESMDVAEAAIMEIAAQKREADLKEVADKYGKSVDSVKELMNKYNLTKVCEIEDLFKMLNIASVENTSVEISESFEPGSAMNSMMTGKAFAKPDVIPREERDQKRNRQHDINESKQCTADRFARMVG